MIYTVYQNKPSVQPNNKVVLVFEVQELKKVKKWECQQEKIIKLYKNNLRYNKHFLLTTILFIEWEKTRRIENRSVFIFYCNRGDTIYVVVYKLTIL